MKNSKKKNLEEYSRIKFDKEFVLLFLLNSKTKYISQKFTVNYSFYKTHKFTTSDLEIKS